MTMELKMTLKEADRLGVIRRAEKKEISLKKAAEELGLSYIQMKRIWKCYRKEGAKGLISKKRGKPSNHRLSSEILEEALEIIKTKYIDYGPTLAKEKLEEKHQLSLSKETLRQLMIKEGLWKAKRIKERKIYARRTRRSRLGELVQIDGSYEHWFEERGEKCCLLVAIDDATSKLMVLRFCKAETTQDYLHFLKLYLELHGRPLAFYSDKHSVFRVNNEQKYEGTFTTQFHKALKKLDIELICAHSPQAKGRVERANGTLQDRLIKELREMGINEIEEGNQYLESYISMHNKKFAVEAANKENAHRQLQESHKKKYVYMEKEERVLSRDLSFQYQRVVYQAVTKDRHRMKGKKVELYLSNGEVQFVLHNGEELKYKKWEEKKGVVPVMDVKEMEVLPTQRKKNIPSRNHPWR